MGNQPFNAEEPGHSRIHFRKHVLWEGPLHIACPRCGRKTRKTTKNMNATWQHECRRPPRQRHDPALVNGKWKCRLCQEKGRKLFDSVCADNDSQHSDATIMESEEVPELAQRLMRQHETRESVTHFDCIRCGTCANKYSKHPDRGWRQKCDVATRPGPKHDIRIATRGWQTLQVKRKPAFPHHMPTDYTDENRTCRQEASEARRARARAH